MSLFGFSDAVTVVGIVAGFFLVLALIVLARVTLRRVPPTYSRYRFGVFVERNGDHHEERDPTTPDRRG